MKVIVFGATGKTGACLVPQLLTYGYEVSVYVRSPEKLGLIRNKLNVFMGDAENKKAMQLAVHSQDVVLSTFGTRSLKKGNTQEIFISNLIEAMKTEKVARLIDLSAWGAGDSHDTSSIIFRLIQATILKAMFEDKNKGEALLLASDINFTLVRPGGLTDKPAKGKVRASSDGKGLSSRISREDVATFMIDQIKNDRWIRKSPIIGY